MANVKLEHPVKEIHGAFTKKGIINRQKKYRDEYGRIIHEGMQEAMPCAICPTTDRLAHNSARKAQIL